ncbi:MAG: uncharacterized protein QOD93_7383 [Acetobacteraceae bacterium]|jgi:uncharacterized protein YegP (UPF0339 family)|nr:uncharacterized protein [Acetobacteraceae bacterium]
MAGKFDLYKDSRGEFRFRLKAGNGEIIATGEGYTTKAGVDAAQCSCRDRRLRINEVGAPRAPLRIPACRWCFLRQPGVNQTARRDGQCRSGVTVAKSTRRQGPECDRPRGTGEKP